MAHMLNWLDHDLSTSMVRLGSCPLLMQGTVTRKKDGTWSWSAMAWGGPASGSTGSRDAAKTACETEMRRLLEEAYSMLDK